MQHLSFVLFQLDEARRYILDGRSQHLRLAFLLLDNAAEIQMDRRIKDDLNHDEIWEHLRNSILETAAQRPHEPIPQSLQEFVDWIPLTRSEKLKLDRFYDEKIAYMVGRGGHLNASLAGPLKHLHKYRNEAYHRAKIRPETIRTATLILLEINCQMLLTVYPGGRTMASDEDYSWLEGSFGIRFLYSDEKLSNVVDEIRSGLLPTDESVANILADHLQDRFAQLDESLDFIVESSGQAANKEEALRESQYYAERQRSTGPQTPPANTFVPKYTLQSIEALTIKLPQVRSAPSRLAAFSQFATIEQELEPVEEYVYALAARIDEAIQMAVDIARGK
jgi:hypothetical protein